MLCSNAVSTSVSPPVGQMKWKRGDWSSQTHEKTSSQYSQNAWNIDLCLYTIPYYHAPHLNSNRLREKWHVWALCWNYRDWLSDVNDSRKESPPVHLIERWGRTDKRWLPPLFVERLGRQSSRKEIIDGSARGKTFFQVLTR